MQFFYTYIYSDVYILEEKGIQFIELLIRLFLCDKKMMIASICRILWYLVFRISYLNLAVSSIHSWQYIAYFCFFKVKRHKWYRRHKIYFANLFSNLTCIDVRLILFSVSFFHTEIMNGNFLKTNSLCLHKIKNCSWGISGMNSKRMINNRMARNFSQV